MIVILILAIIAIAIFIEQKLIAPFLHKPEKVKSYLYVDGHVISDRG